MTSTTIMSETSNQNSHDAQRRYIAIGDIHGQLQQLDEMLARLTSSYATDKVQFIFLGDYIDRGPDSRGVIERLIKFAVEYPSTVFLRGNHEQLFLDALHEMQTVVENPDDCSSLETFHWLQNGGLDTLRSYGTEDLERIPNLLPAEHLAFIQNTLFEFDAGHLYFVHAGVVPPDLTWNGANEGLDARLWIREPFLSYKSSLNDKIVVFGHTPQATGRPLVHRNKIGIDTGAVYGGPLTAVAISIRTPSNGRHVHPIFHQIAAKLSPTP